MSRYKASHLIMAGLILAIVLIAVIGTILGE